MLGSKYPITDVCMTVRDLERAIGFYRDTLGFELRRKAEGFADFKARNVTLALWEIGNIAEHVGYDGADESDGIRKCMVALELPDRADVDLLYETLSAKGVPFRAAPKDYPWRAYCCYFHDPDGNLWEFYSWTGDGPTDCLEAPG